MALGRVSTEWFCYTIESQPEYDKFKFVQTPDVPLNWRVEKMKLSKDKTQIVYKRFPDVIGYSSTGF